MYERDLVPVSFQLQLNRTVVPTKRFCPAGEPGKKMKQSLESRAFLPMARSFGGVKKIIVVHIE